jgi:cysteinyl-tRNA synthetase
MAVIQEMLKSNISEVAQHTAMLDFDRVLGLRLDRLDKAPGLPEAVQKLMEARIKAREAKDFAASDKLRAEIETLGYQVQDTKEGMKVVKK